MAVECLNDLVRFPACTWVPWTFSLANAFDENSCIPERPIFIYKRLAEEIRKLARYEIL